MEQAALSLFLGIILSFISTKFSFKLKRLDGTNFLKAGIICLGGIKAENLKKIRLTKSEGIGSISWIKKNGLNKI